MKTYEREIMAIALWESHARANINRYATTAWDWDTLPRDTRDKWRAKAEKIMKEARECG